MWISRGEGQAAVQNMLYRRKTPSNSSGRQVSAEDGDKPRRVQQQTSVRHHLASSTGHSHLPHSANTESPMTGGDPRP